VQCRVSRPQFPWSAHGTLAIMTPILATKTLAFYDSGFPTEARVINPLLTELVRSRWLDISLLLFLRIYGPRLRLVRP